MMVKENNQFDQRELKRVAGAQRTACGVRQLMTSNSEQPQLRCGGQDDKDSGYRI